MKGPVTIRVPHSQVQPMMDWLADGTGDMTFLRTNSEDVTKQYLELEALLNGLRSTSAELYALVKKAQSTGNAMTEEEQNTVCDLQKVQREIASLEKEKDLLDHQIAFTTVRIDMDIDPEFITGARAGMSGSPSSQSSSHSPSAPPPIPTPPPMPTPSEDSDE